MADDSASVGAHHDTTEREVTPAEPTLPDRALRRDRTAPNAQDGEGESESDDGGGPPVNGNVFNLRAFAFQAARERGGTPSFPTCNAPLRGGRYCLNCDMQRQGIRPDLRDIVLDAHVAALAATGANEDGAPQGETPAHDDAPDGANTDPPTVQPGRVVLRGGRSPPGIAKRYWHSVEKQAIKFCERQNLKGITDPAGRHPVARRWEGDSLWRDQMAERGDACPIVNLHTIILYVQGDKGCIGPEFEGQNFNDDEVQGLDKATRAQLGHWTHQTPEGHHVHQRERGAISAEQRAAEAVLKGKGRATAPTAKGGGKPDQREATPAPKGDRALPKGKGRGRAASPARPGPVPLGPRPPVQMDNLQAAGGKRPRSRSGGA